jgi:hypothetical protein
MHGRVTPALIEEAAGTVEVVEVVAIRLTSPEAQVADLEVGPEVAGRVPVCLVLVLWSLAAILKPRPSTVRMDIVGMVLKELLRLRPEGFDALWAVVDVDVEAIRLVVVLHPAKDIVFDITEEVHVWLHAPIVFNISQGGVLAEHATIPPTHLVVGLFLHVLHLLLSEEVDRLIVEVAVDPAGHGPVVGGNELKPDFGPSSRLYLLFEVVGEGLVVEEGPRVVELVVPSPLCSAAFPRAPHCAPDSGSWHECAHCLHCRGRNCCRRLVGEVRGVRRKLQGVSRARGRARQSVCIRSS